MFKKKLIFLLIWCAVGSSLQSHAAVSFQNNLCGKHIKSVAKETGVPAEVLWAVARTESNYGTGPWPWTVNVAGKGHYFKNAKEMKKFLKSLSRSKLPRTDVGCMQINYGYFSHLFHNNILNMIDARNNILQGAYILKNLHKMNKSDLHEWGENVAEYHSNNPRRGKKYLEKVSKNIMSLHSSETKKVLTH